MKKTVLGMILAATGLFAAGGGLVPDEAAAKIDALFASWNRPGVPGAAVAVVRDAELWIVKGYGAADIEKGIPLGPRTPLNVASLAKMFTALAVLQSAEAGRLKPDDEVRKHLPEIPDFGRPLTVRHLLYHTSGLRDWGELRRMAGGSMDDIVTGPMVLKLLSSQRELNFPPGTEYAYCNAGYCLLAEIVARTSGRTFKEYLGEAVFSPLKMETAFVRDDPSALPEGVAVSYQPTREGRFVPAVNNEAVPGPGSLYLSAEDIGRWLAALAGGAIGSADIRKAMSTPGTTSDGREIPYAAGLIPEFHKGLPVLTHSGRWAGYQAYMIWIPDRRFAAAVLANHPLIDPRSLCRRIVEIGLGGDIPPAAAPSSPAAVGDSALDLCVGRYWLRGEELIVIAKKDGRLTLQLSGDIPRDLTAESPDTFLQPSLGAKIRFYFQGGEKAVRLSFFRSAEAYSAERLPDEEVSPPDLSEYCGLYSSRELGSEIEVEPGEQGLSLLFPKGGDLSLVPVARDRFAGKGALIKIRFVRDSSGGVGELLFSYIGARNVRFVRTSRPRP